MKRVLLQVLTGIFAVTLVNSGAIAAFKVRGDEVAQVEKVAVVGYSFRRDIQPASGNPFKLTKEDAELQETDPEFIMMQEADERVLEVIQGLGAFDLMPREEVLANEFYLSETKDPESKLVMNWYYPKGYRVIKLKKKNAVALCEALGVDAVILLEFKHAISSQGSSTLGVYSKKTTYMALKGEITMFDRTGKELISGSAKSQALPRNTTQGWGDQDNGVSIERDQQVAKMDEFWSALLDGFLAEMK